MNKIKLLYDVVKTMKEKDVFKGTLKTTAVKDQVKIFSFDNTFERSNLNGQLKAKTNTEVDCDGKKMKLENNIDCEIPDCHGAHGFMSHIHAHYHAHQCHGEHSGGIKEGLSRIAAVLSILNSLKVDSDVTNEISLLIDSFNEMVQKLRESEKIKAEYEENRKMLIANISHDLKTPITSIQGYIEAIMGGNAVSQENISKYLKIIYNNSF